MDMKVDIVVIPVTGIDRSKEFYKSLGRQHGTELPS
jgi:hypothetical protein